MNDALYRLNTRRPALFILLVLISAGSGSAILFTPGLPEITKQFAIPSGETQWTVTIFLIGYAIGQLIYAPIANHLGRKPTLYIGISIALLGSLFCALAGKPLHSFSLLIISRLIQALGASTGLVLTFTIINDFYFPEQARKITAYSIAAFAVVPGLSVVIGGFLTQHFDWESCFYFLAAYFFITLLLVTQLPETRVKLNDEIKTYFLHKFLVAFKTFRIVGYALLLGSTTAIIYIFSANAPVLTIKMLGFSPATFGLINLIPASFYFLGNLTTAYTAKFVSIQFAILLGIIAITIGVICFLIFSIFDLLNLYALFLPVAFIYFFIPQVYANSLVMAIGEHPDKASASSVLSFLNILMATLGVFILSVFHTHIFLHMAIIFLLLIVLMLVLFFIIQRIQSARLS